ncbi:uncharacterized protein LOC141673374 [Apium graveolens]|uniref:uncharacterized protein LOC141673374 n=1 Tax=Apium graveolens TaxID=4045 RepID=UPI003D7B6514
MAQSSKHKEGPIGLSFPMITKRNYTAWAMKMGVFMQAHNGWEAIDPRDPKAAVENKIDKRALAMIYQSIPEELLLTLVERKTAKDAWEAIKMVSVGATKVKQAKAQTLKSEFESINLKVTNQLDDLCMKLNGLVARIKALRETIGEEYVVKKMLRAVPAKFLKIASTIEQFGNIETMSNRDVSQVGNYHRDRDNQDGRRQIDRGKIKYFNCGAYGHFSVECRKPRRDKIQRGEANLTQTYDEEPALLMAMTNEGADDIILLSEGAGLNTKTLEEDL